MIHSFREVKSEMKMPWNRDREWKVNWICFEIEIEKWNFSRILEKFLKTQYLEYPIPLDSWKPKKQETFKTQSAFLPTYSFWVHCGATSICDGISLLHLIICIACNLLDLKGMNKRKWKYNFSIEFNLSLNLVRGFL